MSRGKLLFSEGILLMITKILTAALLVGAASAQAVTYTSVYGAPDSGVTGGDVVFVDFDTPVAATGFSLSGSYGLTTGSTSAAATPAGDTTKYLFVSSALPTDTATLTSPFDLSRVGFYWGSIDTYNSVDVLGTRNGGATQTLFTLGGGAMPPANGDQSGASTNRRVTFTADAGEAITGLKFTSTGVAFELDDVAGSLLGNGSPSTVPEPASWALLVGGFAMIGAAARRRRTTAIVAA